MWAHRLFIPAETELVSAVTASVRGEENLSPFEREVLAGRITLEIENRAVADSRPSVWARVGAWRRGKVSMRFAAAVVAIAAVEAGVIAWMLYPREGAAPPAVAVQTSASGEHVVVPGGSVDPAALGVVVGPDFGWVRVTTASSEGALGTTSSESGVAALRISSPIELKVLEGSRVIGSVPGRDLQLSAGQHEIELVNEELGYRVRQTIVAEAGQVIAIHVSPLPGWISIEAPDAPEVSVDGKAVGRAPLGPLALAAGEHEVTFTYRGGRSERQRITVKTGETTQVVGKGR